MPDHETMLRALRRHWEYGGHDQDVAHEIYRPDAVLEFPQSGERFEGVENFREWRRGYPGVLRFFIRRLTLLDGFAVAENLISYDGAPWMFTVNLMELEDDRIVRERIYIMDGWDPADFREPYRASLDVDRPLPSLDDALRPPD
jgi:hypothetical protein